MLLALKPAAERIGVYPDTLRKWGEDGPAFTRTRGGHRRFDPAELDRWIAETSQRTTASNA